MHYKRTANIRILCLASIVLCMLLLCGCRVRVTDNTNYSRTVPDEDGLLRDEYEMRRDELGLTETKESVFSRFDFSGQPEEEEEEFHDENFESEMENYDPETIEEPEGPEDTSQNQQGGNRQGTPRVPRRNGGGGGGGKLPEIKTVTVTLDANGGTVSGGKFTRSEGDLLGELPVPQMEGYTFEGWYTEAEGGEKVTAETKVTGSGTVTLYAHWKAIPQASARVTFDPNGGSISSGDSTKTVRKGDAYGSFPGAAYDGYELIGWFTEPEGGTQVSEEDIFDSDSDMTLYAHWEYNAYKYWDTQLSYVNISDSDKADCYIEIGDHETTGKSALLNMAKANNVAGSKDKTVTDDKIISWAPDYIIIVVNSMDNASTAKSEMQDRLKDEEGNVLLDPEIIVVPKAAVNGSDSEKLYYGISLCNRLYSGVFSESEVSQARSELGAGEDIQ